MKKQRGSPAGEAGQTLLEILLAFSVAIMVMSAVIFGITTSLSNAQYTKNQNLANSYAQEGMTVVRKIRDSGWTTFSSYSSNTTYCLGPNKTDLNKDSDKLSLPNTNCWAQSPVPAGGPFSREVVFDNNQSTNKCCSDNSSGCSTGTAGTKATVRVSWSDNKCPVGTPLCHSVEIITCFSNIDLKPTP